MWKLISAPKTIKATPKIADFFASMEPCPHDRPLKQSIMRMLQSALDEGQIRTFVWASAYCKEDEKVYRVNGKHSSTLLAKQEYPATATPYVSVEEYECDTLKDVADLYCTFDAGKSGRSIGDMSRVYLTDSELAEVGPFVFNKAIAGIAYATWGDSIGNHDHKERIDLALQHVEFTKWLKVIIGTERLSKVLHRSGVIAAMFATYNLSPFHASEFWEAVRDGTDPNPDAPTRKLQRFLLSTGSNLTYANKGKKVATAREFMARCLTAWNAWRKGIRTELKYFATAEMPVAV